MTNKNWSFKGFRNSSFSTRFIRVKKIAINKLEATFQSSVRISEALFDKLVVALFTWTTTHRNKEEILLEDLYEALSIESYDFKGIVSLPTTEPFIDSRVKFCEDFERNSKYR